MALHGRRLSADVPCGDRLRRRNDRPRLPCSGHHMSPPAGAAVLVNDASKSFGRISALREVSLKVDPSEAIAIAGRSGSGKSTLLGLIGGLSQPDSGQVLIDGRAIWKEPHPA